MQETKSIGDLPANYKFPVKMDQSPSNSHQLPPIEKDSGTIGDSTLLQNYEQAENENKTSSSIKILLNSFSLHNNSITNIFCLKNRFLNNR